MPQKEEYEPPVPYQKKDKVKPYREIVLDAIDTCRKEGSKHLTTGGRKTIMSNGVPITIDLPDQRETYIQSIKSFQDLMLYFYDEDAEKIIEEQEEEMSNIPKTIMESYLKREQNQMYKNKTRQTGIIQKGSKSMVGEMVLQEAEEMKLNCYRKIYQELLSLFKRKRELSNIRKIGAYE
jgi:hypothetical protein